MTRHHFRRSTGAAAVLVLAALLGACSGSGSDAADSADAAADAQAGNQGDAADDLAAAQEDSGVPAECLEAFPAAFGAPDLGSVTMLPADWPEPPVESTLCHTSATAEGNVEIADYATDVAPDAVLAAFDSGLPAGYEVAYEDQGLGEMLVGTAGGVSFQVTARDGAFSIMFGEG